MTPISAEAAFLKARLAAAQVRRSREGAVFSCAGRLLPTGSGAIQAAPMQGSGSAVAIAGSVLPFGRTSWLLKSPSGWLGASAAWQTLVLALLRFVRAAPSTALRSHREDASDAVSWLTTTKRGPEHYLLLGLPRAVHGVLDTRNCKTARAWGDSERDLMVYEGSRQNAEVTQGPHLSVTRAHINSGAPY